MTQTSQLRAPRLRLQEGGLVLVVLVLGALLALFGGSVKSPKFEKNAAGERVRAYTTNATGEREPVFVEKNKFLNAQNLAQLAKDTSFIAIMAVGATYIIIAGCIDLSVGAIYALASVLAAIVLNKAGADGSWWQVALGMAVCVGAATVCGLVNGGILVMLKVHPFIITLGTMAIFRGIAFVVTNGQSIGDFPHNFRDLVRQEVGDGLILVPMLVMVMVAVVAGIYLTRTQAGRYIYAVGGNEAATRFSGISTNRVKLGVFFVSGLTAGVAALLSLGYYGSGTSGDGEGYELNVIAAAVVGGASLTGGKGTALGAVLGALIIQMISSGIVILDINQNYSKIITGSVVVLAVVLDQVNNWMAKRRQLRAVN
jgi:ribose transport system permease protein